MNPSHVAGLRPRLLLTLLASAAITTTGCSNLASTSTAGTSAAALKVTGTIHGGNQPVSGATVSLYLAGAGENSAGFHSVAKLVATTTSANDGYGSFSFNKFTPDPNTSPAANDGTTSTFSCTGDNYVFVVAKGGTTVNTTNATPNSDAEFIAPLGPCSTIDSSTQVNMSEVVTVATMASIHQYLDPSSLSSTKPTIQSTLGSDGIFVSGQALIDSFSRVSNMVDLTTGMGNSTVTRTGLGVTVTITPEIAKINQLANIISACINQTTSGSATCQTIYSSAVPPANISATSAFGTSFPAATDLLTALYYIFANPTNSSSANMTALYNLSAASGAPYQPTLSAMPTDWSIGISYAASGTCSTSGANFINNPSEILVGLRGNIYFTNSAAAGSQAEMNSVGVPVACQAVANAGGGVVDSQGNTWVASNSGNTITRFSQLLASSLVFPTPTGVISIAADGYGDIFFSGNDNKLYELPNGATSLVPVIPVVINSQSIGAASHLIVDPSNRVWATSGSSFITATQGTPFPTPSPSVQATTLVFDPLTSTTPVTTLNPSVGLAATSANRGGIYSSSGASGSQIQAQGGSVTPFAVDSASGAGLNSPVALALDGAGNVWAANGGTSNALAAFDASGAALTPSTGFVKAASYLGPQSSISIDASGDVWVGLSGGNTVTEIVGAAVPVYQPYSNGLAPNTVRFGLIP